MMCCWNGKQPVCNRFKSALKFMGCSRFNSILWGGGRGLFGG
jgi:hypothetical protein